MPGEAMPNGFEHLIKDLYFRLEERDRWADHIIRFLSGTNGGGIIVAMTYAGVLKNTDNAVPLLLGVGLFMFAVGLSLVGVLLYVSAEAVRDHRRKARPIFVKVLEDPAYHYNDAFKDLGDRDVFRSKWPKFKWVSIVSFAFFLGALLASFLAIAGVRLCGV